MKIFLSVKIIEWNSNDNPFSSEEKGRDELD